MYIYKYHVMLNIVSANNVCVCMYAHMYELLGKSPLRTYPNAFRYTHVHMYIRYVYTYVRTYIVTVNENQLT